MRARCPKGFAVVGGGLGGLDYKYRLVGSYPLVENRTPVGWAIVLGRSPRYTIVPGERVRTSAESTVGSFGKSHSHAYDRPARLLPLEASSAPEKITVYAVCVRLLTLQVAKPRQPGGGTRKG